MIDKSKVKVIKKAQIDDRKRPVKPVVKTKRAAAREMVSTVTTWVSDFQTRKRDETKIALEKLFAQQPQPTES
ncbi:MAG: hypothetical protein JNK51_01690 [Blastocatellia bacterium]|nr:hypothetical protein [Chloracidobacterium sp.]MBL8183610.1 hypothetical protein [Blastocatellia bacterium]HBE83097.1 hypothetical protein [Blastocatellia bacterium]HRJ89563.1 hypothetical protein [Pyrinomonadaceae bacterium]HRK50796.1 hypothetical protein [Pyrinomonadaceae bacterium]